MFTVTALSYGTVDFVRQNNLEGMTNPARYIPGSEVFAANHSFGQFYYQRVKQKDFTLWKSVYMPSQDITVRVQRNKPWIGFSVVLRKSLRHIVDNRVVPMMQGQFNMVYVPFIDNSFHLKKDEICEALDIQLSRELLERLAIQSSEFDLFRRSIGNDSPAWIRLQPVFGGALILDVVDELLDDPSNEAVFAHLIKQIVESLVRPRQKERLLTQQQIEQLFVVRELLRTELIEPGHLNDWAMRAHMNTTYFKEMFRQVFEFSPHHYLLYERIRAAEKLILEQPDISVNELVTRCGFKHYNNLRRSFYAKHKKTISEWKDVQQFLTSLVLCKAIMEDSP